MAIDYSKKTRDELYVLLGDAQHKDGAKKALEALFTAAANAETGTPKVSFNSSGGICFQQGFKGTISEKTKGRYEGTANMPREMARLLCGDDPVSVKLRDDAMMLLATDENERNAIVSAKKTKKMENATKELRRERSELVRLIEKYPSAAPELVAFDLAHPEIVPVLTETVPVTDGQAEAKVSPTVTQAS